MNFSFTNSYEDNKARYRDLVKKLHPDKPGGDQKKFQALQEEWDKYEAMYKKVESLNNDQKKELKTLLDQLQDLQQKGSQVSSTDQGWHRLEKFFDPIINRLEKQVHPFVRFAAKHVLNQHNLNTEHILKGIYKILNDNGKS